MRRSAIGVFDSGIGGLTVANEIGRQLPHEDIIYLGDTARLPYGTKSAATVCRYAERATGLLLKYPVKAVVVACNTASAQALPSLRAMTEMPVIGVVEPGALAAVETTRSGRVGIAGTEATVRSGAYHQALRALRGDLELFAQPWPLLVPFAEEGWIEHAATRLVLSTYLEPFVTAKVDTIVLGCTHYPLFKGVIQSVLAEEFQRKDIALVDSAEALTAQLAELLAGHDLAAPERAGRRTFFCTDAPERFTRVGGQFFPSGDLSTTTSVDL